MKIGVLSDTHGVLKSEFLEEMKTCDYLIHAGDIGSEKCYETLNSLGVPVYVVRGNSDHGHWAKYLPETLAFPIDGKIFYLIHDLSQMPYIIDEPDVVICGHTHQRTAYQKRGRLYLNPGSAGKSRGVSGVSMAIVTLEDGEIQYRFVEL